MLARPSSALPASTISGLPGHEDTSAVKQQTKTLLVWLGLIVAVLALANLFNTSGKVVNISYAKFMDTVDKEWGDLKRSTNMTVAVHPSYVDISYELDGTTYQATGPVAENLYDKLSEKQIDYRVEPEEDGTLLQFALMWLPMIFIVVLMVMFMRQMQAGGGRAMNFGKSKARLLNEHTNKVTFKDVAGVEEAREDVEEIIDFLRDTRKYLRVGGRIPKGVLLMGPPGTGKTLLARAIAGEAGVAFFSISGSDFVEMFVGVGASRVRDLFEQGKKNAPCIIFIDEIDAVGRHRGTGLGGGHDEREQTLNQLLVEMDGFEGNDGVILVAATNRPDVLDPALLRPGRFDRQVVVGLPDVRGREQILRVHMRKLPLADDVVPMVIARGTPGFSGADLANLCNEAALFAARESGKEVRMEHFDRARDKIIMGTERRSLAMSEEEKLNTAYHESGHAIVGRLVPEHDPVYKVTIIPRDRALGVTVYLPEGDKYSINRTGIESRLATLYGGRVAEELIFGSDKVTTGASNDIERATKMARNMVTKWGLSEELGPITYAEEEEEVFLGRSVSQHKNVSDDTARKIDEVVRTILDKAYARTTALLTANLDKLHKMAETLMLYETIDVSQIDAIMEGREPPPPVGWTKTEKGDVMPLPPIGGPAAQT